MPWGILPPGLWGQAMGQAVGQAVGPGLSEQHLETYTRPALYTSSPFVVTDGKSYLCVF